CCCCCCSARLAPPRLATSPTGSRWTAGPCRAGTTRPRLASSFTGACSPCQGSATSGSGGAGAVYRLLCGLSKPFVDFMAANYPPGFTYADFAREFKAELFNPEAWATPCPSGAKYVVLTSKHHEGYCLWNTSHSFNWNSRRLAPGRNLLAELAAAIRNRSDGPRFGVYHSLYEWYNPLYLTDAQNNFTLFRYKTMAELYELVNQRSGVLELHRVPWPGCNNDSPVRDSVVTNDRWGFGTACKHGGYFTCQGRLQQPGKLVSYKFENAMTLIKGSWGYVRNLRLTDIYSLDENARDCCEHGQLYGGNVLMKHCPTLVRTLLEERLLQLGDCCQSTERLCTNSTPWHLVYYTSRPDLGSVYGLPDVRPSSAWRRPVRLASPKFAAPGANATLLGCPDGGSACPGSPTGRACPESI
uniref:alpha-L-fucosidase n=1 Tax=Macrostomum lignano TaxID=282301 RepID=A0A1I8FET2_9PLAT